MRLPHSRLAHGASRLSPWSASSVRRSRLWGWLSKLRFNARRQCFLLEALFAPVIQYLVIPGVITAFSVAVIFAALQLELSPPMIVGDSLQPRVFPILLMVINLVLAAILFFQYRTKPPTKVQLEGIQTWGSIALFLIFYPITVFVDMLIAIAVVMFVMCLLWGERRIYVAGTVALATPVAIFLLFDTVLRVRFPRGLLTNWYYG